MKRITLIFSLVLISFCAIAQQYLTSTGFPAPYTPFNAFLPDDMLSTVYDANGIPTMDRLYLSLRFDDDQTAAAVSQMTGAEVTVGEVYIMLFTVGEDEQSIYYLPQNFYPVSNQINLYGTQGERIYFSSKYCPLNMYAFEYQPHISPAGIQPTQYQSVLSSMLPDDFMNAIYGTDGKALMDELFVLLQFEEPIVSMLSLPQAGTYYSSFVKVTNSDGNEYYMPTNMNLATASNIIISNRPAGRNIYFTGEVSDAYTGSFDDMSNISEGFVQINGTDGDLINVYMHDFKINSVPDKDLGNLDNLNNVFGVLAGLASPIVVCSNGERTDTPLTVKFHVRGNNRLAGGAISKYMSASNQIFEALADIVALTGAPINARPNALEFDKFALKTHKFTFDDKWYSVAGTTFRTNGLLDLTIKEDGDRSTPAIDLGNGKGVCEFDGGQYIMTTAISNSIFYVSSMSICYRMTVLMGNRFGGVGSSVSSTSNDIPYNLYIKDGTFSTHSAYDYRGTVDVVGQGWYADYSDLRVPFKTIIDGGSFNGCDVYACDASAEQGDKPYNSNGVRLCHTDVEVPEPTNDNGTATLVLSYYNTESMTPDKVVDDAEQTHYYVHPYLPLDDCPNVQKEHLYNWITLIPKMGAANLLTMGGDVEVRDMEDDELTPRKNGYLFYTQLGKYTKNNAEPLSLAGYTPTVETAMNFAAGSEGVHEFSGVTNYNDYTIQYGIYTMLTFDANKWYNICPPFDVHNIYVVETLPDDTLPYFGMTTSDIGTENYLKKQGEMDGILAKGIVTSLIPDIFSGKGSGVSMNLVDIAQKTLNLPANPIVSYNPALEGHSSREANFWMYEQVDSTELDPAEGRSGFWHIDTLTDNYSKYWTPATPYDSNTDYVTQEGEVISNPKIWLKCGHHYSLFFPARNNYWTGKYIVFEGYGPQTLAGRSRHSDFLTPYEMYDDNTGEDLDNAIALQGNYTFANDTLPLNIDEDGEKLYVDDSGYTYRINGAGEKVYTDQDGNALYYNNDGAQYYKDSDGNPVYPENYVEPQTEDLYPNQIFLPKNVSGSNAVPRYDWVRQDVAKNMGNTGKSAVLIKPFDVYMVMSMTNTDTYASLSELTEAKRVAQDAAQGGAPANQHTTTHTSRPTVDERVMDIWTSHERINLFAYANENITIYNLMGQLMWQGSIIGGNKITLVAPQGIYIVQTTNNATKVVVN